MKKSKKLLSILLAVLLFASLLPLSALAAALPFKDVPQDAWYYPVVREAYEKGITTGVTHTTFEPNATVTREQFLVMLYRAADIKLDIFHTMFSKWEEEVIQKSYFSDVKKDTWYAETVCLAKEMDVAYGVAGVRFEGDEAVAQARFGVGEPITRESANLVIAQLLHLESQDPDKDISLYIDSPGGEVYAGLGILDTMNFIKPEVSTICVGMAASMAAVLLACGAKGKRLALPNSMVLIHQPSSGVEGQQTDIQIVADETKWIRQRLNEILSEATGQPIEKVNADTERDNYLRANEALEYGLVDRVITSRTEQAE